MLNHERAAFVALEHLAALGHKRIAFIKGQAFSSDTAVRWRAIRAGAQRIGLAVDSTLVTQLEGDDPSPDLGYHTTRRLLGSGRAFTALFAFNDISAIGAIRALREAGRRVPEDVSVVGFDDIQSAAYPESWPDDGAAAAAADGRTGGGKRAQTRRTAQRRPAIRVRCRSIPS